MIEKTQNKIAILFWMMVVLLIGVVFLPHFLPLMINADSYAILMPAKLWQQYGYVGGELGNSGDYFYPLFYRGGLSLLILLVNVVTNLDLYIVAEWLILFSYILSLVLVYLLVIKLIGSIKSAILATFLLAFSFSFRSWSGVLMAEIPTIMLFLATLTALVYSRNWSVLLYLSAVLMGVTLAFRLEMVVLVIGVMIFMEHIYPKKNLLKWIWGFIVVGIWLVYEAVLYFMVWDAGWWLGDQVVRWKQTMQYHELFLYFAIFLVLCWVLSKISRWLLLLPVGLFVYILIGLNWDWYNILKPLLEFVKNDVVLVVVAMISVIYMLFMRVKLVVPLVWCLLMLLVVYFSRQEYRYYVHLVALLVLLASYLLKVVVENKNKWVKYGLGMVLIGAIVYQAKVTLGSSFLPQLGYEQVVVEETKEVLAENNLSNVVVCSMFSEAMYFVTGIPSIDCFEGVNDLNRSKVDEVLVVVDEDMARHQPDFVAYLETNKQAVLIAEKWVLQTYVEKNSYSFPKFPVRWYVVRSKK